MDNTILKEHCTRTQKLIHHNLEKICKTDSGITVGDAADRIQKKVTETLNHSQYHKKVIERAWLIYNMATDIIALKNIYVRECSLKDYLSGEWRKQLSLGQLLIED
ncbi:MAG: hypothetical protein ABH824_03030 [Nanoarchaeota archaeon]|nr:hypothetical protein [Nanoarchaeota archaeon]MBU1632299.1 hypothetical protein [Nanoarchaeota archaeon]MBU1875750.1 hypothetical protein [Nanoarchaeota archaeon]